mgnify:FL=1
MMNNEIIVPYLNAIEVMEDADVLLYRGGNFPSFGWWIKKYTGGIHSHAALYHKNSTPTVIEFREFKGSRMSSLQQHSNDTIDVFRLSQNYHNYIYSNEPWQVSLCNISGEDSGSCSILNNTTYLSKQIRQDIVETAKSLTGLPYGWKIIGKIGLSYLPLVRLLYPQPKVDKNGNKDIFVCSTFVSYCIRQHYVDLVPFLPDILTKPSDLARSPLLHYLFTIGF